MPANLLAYSDVWPRVTELAKRKKGHVAVAFCGSNASKLLPLRRGSLLVVNFGEPAVIGGMTDPQSILEYIRRGVEVHSCENLHAKVFIFGTRAIIGSMNVSRHSRDYLVEAAIETTDRGAVAFAREFVEQLKGDYVSAAYALRMKNLYEKPRIVGGKRLSPRGRPRYSPMWAVQLVRKEWDEEDNQAAKQARPSARRRIRSSNLKLDEFLWVGFPLYKSLREGQRVLTITSESNKKKMVAAPSRVIRIKRYRVGSSRRAIVFLETPRHKRRKDLRKVDELLGPVARHIKKIDDAKLISDHSFVLAIGQIW